jgi:hypothetical protein
MGIENFQRYRCWSETGSLQRVVSHRGNTAYLVQVGSGSRGQEVKANDSERGDYFSCTIHLDLRIGI